MNVKDRSYNQLCWEMDRRSPDWRMRSPSDEGEAMRNSPERGPLGPGGVVRRRSPAHRGGRPSGRGDSEGASQLSGRVVDVGIALKPPAAIGRLSAELRGAWNFKPYWGKPTVRNFRGGGWKRGHGSRTEAHAERRGTATGPYRARQCSTRQGAPFQVDKVPFRPFFGPRARSRGDGCDGSTCGSPHPRLPSSVR